MKERNFNRIRGTVYMPDGVYSKYGNDRADVLEQIRLLLQHFHSNDCDYVKLKSIGHVDGYPSDSENFMVRFCGKSKYIHFNKPKSYEITISFSVVGNNY